MPFGFVTKTYLEQRMKELRTELEQAEFEARAWYDKFRRLYARMVKAQGTGDAKQPADGEHDSPSASDVAGPRLARPISRRGF